MKSAIRHDANGIVTAEPILIDDVISYFVYGESEDEPELIECSDTESDDEYADADTDDENDFLPVNRNEPSLENDDNFEGAPTGITCKLDTTSGPLYLDENLQCVEPNISMLATAKMNYWIIDPASFAKNATETLTYPIQRTRPTRNRVHVFIAFDQEGCRYRAGVDSFAEVSLISPRLIKEHWTVTNGPGVIMRGIGAIIWRG